MSGLEIAGVVLGALPLVISALEHYAKGIDGVIRYCRYGIHLQSLIDSVKTQQVIFKDNLEHLLTGIVRSDQMSVFIADPTGQPKADLRLKERLQGSYEVYFANVRGMQVALTTMMAKLKLGNDGKPQFADTSLFRQEYRRLKFSISKSAYEDQLRDLRHFNGNLSELTGKSLVLEPSRRRSKPRVEALRTYAKNLYFALLSSLRCGCINHAVNLRMEHQGMHHNEPRNAQVSFHLVFTNSVGPSADPTVDPTAFWQEVVIRQAKDAPVPTLMAPVIASDACLHSKPRRKVQFRSIEVQIGRVSESLVSKNIAFAQAAPPEIIPGPQVPQIRDLCTTIGQPSLHDDVCVGYILDNTQQRHEMYPKPTCLGQQKWMVCTLDQLLASTTNQPTPLSLHDKLRIAVHLGSGVLHLYKTPWLSENWQQSDVRFIHRPDTPKSSMYEHPFVCRDLPQRSTRLSSPTDNTVYRVIRNKTLYMLGIVLVELCYGKPIRELQEPQDLDCEGTPGVEWCTADRLLKTKDLENHLGKRYADAVRRCVYCDFPVDEADLDDEGFQQLVYEGVLEKLEESLQLVEG